MLMTKKALADICKEQGLYRTPALNDKLYLNFKGFNQIENLDEYCNVRALFLEGNALETLDGLPQLKELRCLFVQQNCLWHISGLEGLENLDTINISSNQIKRLENLSCCKNLRTVIATHNRLESYDSIAHLAQCTSLTTVDLQNNKISDPAVLDIFKQLPELKCLYLKGNPVVSNIKNYRKVLIAALPNLTYLDDRPVFDVERQCSEAWVIGGVEAERETRKRLKDAEEEANRRNFEYMQAIRKEAWRKRREQGGLSPGDTDPLLDDISDDDYTFLEDPPELVEARRKLAAFSAREGEEEPPELSQARHGLVNEGKEVKAGQWGEGAAVREAEVYYESVRANQRDLNSTAPAAASQTGTASGQTGIASSQTETHLPAPSPATSGQALENGVTSAAPQSSRILIQEMDSAPHQQLPSPAADSPADADSPTVGDPPPAADSPPAADAPAAADSTPAADSPAVGDSPPAADSPPAVGDTPPSADLSSSAPAPARVHDTTATPPQQPTVPADSSPASVPADSSPLTAPADSSPATAPADSPPLTAPADSPPAAVPADSSHSPTPAAVTDPPTPAAAPAAAEADGGEELDLGDITISVGGNAADGADDVVVDVAARVDVDGSARAGKGVTEGGDGVGEEGMPDLEPVERSDLYDLD